MAATPSANCFEALSPFFICQQTGNIMQTQSNDAADKAFDRWNRRQVLCAGGIGLSGLLGLPALAQQPSAKANPVRPYGSYDQLLETIRQRGHKYRIVGAAPDKSPLVVVKAGGKKKPAIVISGGSHATEHAGPAAAVELLDRLQTEHEVWVLPTRDPIGMNGYRYALSLGLGEMPRLNSLDEVDALLRQRGEVLYESGDTLLVQIGEYGYANTGLYRQIEKGAPFLESLRGRRIYFPSRSNEMPGAGPLERAYTLVVTTEGEVLHLNRFHDTAWAPAEVRAIRNLMADVQPGLTFDLHEHGREFYWMSARRQRTEADEMWERRMASVGIEAVAASGAALAPEEYSPGSFFERLQRGVYWLDPSQRGEGLNLADYAAAKYGPSFTIETGMKGPFEQRVGQHLLIVQTAVKVFEERYR